MMGPPLFHAPSPPKTGERAGVRGSRGYSPVSGRGARCRDRAQTPPRDKWSRTTAAWSSATAAWPPRPHPADTRRCPPGSGSVCPAGVCFHVLNRAVARLPLFEKDKDYEAFERVLAEAFEREPLPVFAYCIMPNHWHFVVRPNTNRQLSSFFRWLTHTHSMRWHAHYGTGGTEHLYQGRFKTFPIEQDEHLLAVIRYVERNPLRASLCSSAEEWNSKHGQKGRGPRPPWRPGPPAFTTFLAEIKFPIIRNCHENAETSAVRRREVRAGV